MKICVKLGLCLLLICANAKVVQAQDVNTTASEKAKMMEKGELKRLEELAKSVSKRAYCPYSKFSVGAVVVTDTGEEFAGCNVENASYGLTICAERNAVFQMVASEKRKFALVIIYTPTPQPAAPCGACRQVINEFGPEARIISICDGADRIDTSLAQLLPQAFGPKNLSEK